MRVGRELHYMYREVGAKMRLKYLDYSLVEKNFYGDIVGGTLYVRDMGGILGAVKADPEFLYRVVGGMPLFDIAQDTLFKISARELYQQGILDEGGNWIPRPDGTSGDLEGFANSYVFYNNEVYYVKSAQPAFVYRGETGSMYLATTKISGGFDVYKGKAKLEYGDPPNERGEIIRITSANLVAGEWVDHFEFPATTLTPLTPLLIYIADISHIPNLSEGTKFVIGDLVYDVVDYSQTPKGDYAFTLQENTEIDKTEINPVDPPIDPPVDPPVEEGELSEVISGEEVYYTSRLVKLYDLYAEGNFKFSSQVIGEESTPVVLGKSPLNTTHKEHSSTVLNLYSADMNLFTLPNEILVSFNEKEIEYTVVVVEGEVYEVVGRVLLEGDNLYRFELAPITWGTLNVSDIPTPPVPDTSAPVISMTAGNVNIELGSNYNDSFIISRLGVMVEDNSGETITPIIEGTYDKDVKGIYNMVVSATDSANNRAEKPFTITVRDTQVPTITGVNAEVEAGTGTMTEEEIKTALQLVVTDNDEVTVTIEGTVDLGTPKTNTITVTATDVTGNTTSKDFTITVGKAEGTLGRPFSNVGVTKFVIASSSTVIRKSFNNVNILLDGAVDGSFPTHDDFDVSGYTLYVPRNILFSAELIDAGGAILNTPPSNTNGRTQGAITFMVGSSRGNFGITSISSENGGIVDDVEYFEVKIGQLDLTYKSSVKYKRNDFAYANKSEFTD